MQKYSKDDRLRIAANHGTAMVHRQEEARYLRKASKDPARTADERKVAEDLYPEKLRLAGFHGMQQDLWVKSANIMNTLDQF